MREDVLKSTKHYECFAEEHLRFVQQAATNLLTLEERKQYEYCCINAVNGVLPIESRLLSDVFYKLFVPQLSDA